MVGEQDLGTDPTNNDSDGDNISDGDEISLYGINPMVGVVEGFRWALLGTDTRPGPMIIVSTITALLMLVGGLYYFKRLEKSFADVV